MFDLYHVLVFVHVAAAVAWVGGGLILALLAQQVRADGAWEEMAALVVRTERFRRTFFMPASILTIMAGIGMGIIGGILSAPWISAGFLGVFASLGIEMGYLAPKGRQLQALLRRHPGVGHPEVVGLGDRMLLASRIDLAILLLILAVMVFKPGAI